MGRTYKGIGRQKRVRSSLDRAADRTKRSTIEIMSPNRAPNLAPTPKQVSRKKK